MVRHGREQTLFPCQVQHHARAGAASACGILCETLSLPQRHQCWHAREQTLFPCQVQHHARARAARACRDRMKP